MQIKKIDTESYESIKAYLDLLFPLNHSLLDLSSIEYDGKFYMVSIGEEGLAIVENDKGELNPYLIPYKDEDGNYINTEKISSYFSELYKYKYKFDEYSSVVEREDRLSGEREQLVYIPKIENDPNAFIEHIQTFGDLENVARYVYDVTNRDSLEAGLLYTRYHKPDMLDLKIARYLFDKLFYTKRMVYCKSLKGDYYERPLFKKDNIFIGCLPKMYDVDVLLEEMTKYGVRKEIPSDLNSILSNNSDEVKKLNLISDTFKSFNKVQ